MPLDFQIDAENSPVDAKEEARQAAKAIVEEILNKVCAPFAEEVPMSENAPRKPATEPHVQDGVQLKLTQYNEERSEVFCTPSASPNAEALRHPSEESDATVGEDTPVEEHQEDDEVGCGLAKGDKLIGIPLRAIAPTEVEAEPQGIIIHVSIPAPATA